MRINIYGVPGSGKTTLAADIFSELKKRNRRVEHITEQAKPYALRGEPIIGWAQVDIFIQQLRAEERALAKVPCVVTDCPLWLMVAYAEYHDNPSRKQLAKFARRFDEEHPESISILLSPREEYDTLGRLHTKEELPRIHLQIHDVLSWNEQEILTASTPLEVISLLENRRLHAAR